MEDNEGEGRAAVADLPSHPPDAFLARRPVPPWVFGTLFGVGVVLAVLARLSLFDFEGNDYRCFMGPWYDYIASHGGLQALKDRFSDYTPPYLYLLVLAAALPLKKLYAIKLVSVLFDFVLAGGIALIVRERRRGAFWPACAFLVTLVAPTVLVNSALWGQNDAVFASFLVLSLALLLRGRNSAALLMFGVSFAFKAQAVFLFPLFLVLLLKRQLEAKKFLLIPAAYFALMLPALAVGRPVTDLLLVYPRQAGEYRHLTMGAPNLYQWLPDNYDLFRDAGLLFAASAALLVVALGVRHSEPLGRDGIVRLAMVSLLVVPFALPGMHERYFFTADAVAVVYAFFFPRLFAVPVAVGPISLFSYLPFLLGLTIVPFPYLSIAMLAVIAVVIADWVRSLKLEGPTETIAGAARE